MAHQRGHRQQGDLEVGATDLFIRHPTPHVAPRQERPVWLEKWESKRPKWLMECLAEAFGVFVYCWGGMGASAAFYTASAAKIEGFGSLLTVGFAYALAITLAITLIGPTSGSHLNPCFTICFALFKGFPWRKVPQYIIAQILGGFIAGLLVYVQFKQPLDLITEELTALGAAATIYTPTGPASPIALFKGATQSIGLIFVNEFIAAFFIAVAVFSILDPSNIFVSPNTGPVLIGCAYFVAIVCYASQSLALNTARDVGGRLAAACIWGRGVFHPGSYTALAALTNILASICGALFQILILSDSNRPAVHAPPATPAITSGPLPDLGPSSDYVSSTNGHHDNGKQEMHHTE